MTTQKYSICDYCNWKDETFDETGADYYCQRRMGIYTEQMEGMKKCPYLDDKRFKEAKG